MTHTTMFGVSLYVTEGTTKANAGNESSTGSIPKGTTLKSLSKDPISAPSDNKGGTYAVDRAIGFGSIPPKAPASDHTDALGQLVITINDAEIMDE